MIHFYNNVRTFKSTQKEIVVLLIVTLQSPFFCTSKPWANNIPYTREYNPWSFLSSFTEQSVFKTHVVAWASTSSVFRAE